MAFEVLNVKEEEKICISAFSENYNTRAKI
jgi:hypothetical protein